MSSITRDQPDQVDISRRKWRVAGQVQGVGFRPFVLRLAEHFGIAGTVCNDPGGVTIDAWGTASQLDAFAQALETQPPPLASIESIHECHGEGASDTSPTARPDSFTIIASDHDSRAPGRVTVDSATCADCVRELFDQTDRRYQHPLINCTNCGPRYTIIHDLPYDRPRTTMADFAMCPTCDQEYGTPSDRRYHAQPTCCPSCGPQVTFISQNEHCASSDAFSQAADLLARGGILAMKGLGGYHLVVDATNEDAVQRLRRAKHRDSKPFAIMVPTLESARAFGSLSHHATQLLQSPAAPIVLATRRVENDSVAHSVTAGCHRIGIMVPYTPMQYLLFAEPALALRPLVMTSANLSDDPLIKDDEVARLEFAEIADGFLTHDRPILRAVDDSIVADTTEGLLPIRVARGYVPMPIALPHAAPAPGLCTGGELKNTVSLVRNNEAIVSQHIGDLSHLRAYQRFEQTINDLLRLYDVCPQWVACDLHPRYLARRHARALARQYEVPLIEVQHHHAHLASIAAEHGHTDPIIGLICDGVGYGPDGTAWGGEILIGDCRSFSRLGRLKPLRLPGGDAAARDTVRCAVSWLYDADLAGPLVDHHIRRLLPDQLKRMAVLSMLESDLSCPPSSGMGRLFDAAASLLGICVANEYEAMSGLLLEAAASRARSHPSGEGLLEISLPDDNPCFDIETTPLLSALLNHCESSPDDPGPAAWMFHDAIADGLARAAERVAEPTGVTTVGLSGGVFCNALLTDLTAMRLRVRGLEVLTHRRIPPNDGGIAYGQAAIAAARLTTTDSDLTPTCHGETNHVPCSPCTD